MGRTFSTVSEELREHAECVADYFQGLGWTVKVEPRELGYPYTPTLRCRRPPTTLLIELSGTVGLDRIAAWTGFCRSRNKDTRVALALPAAVQRRPDEDASLRSLGAGLYLTDGQSLVEALPPMDLAVNVALPELKSLSPKVRKALGPAYEQFMRSHWREGFEDACQALEVHARTHLATGLSSGRLAFVTDAGRPRILKQDQVDRMTLGQLAVAYGQIRNQNYTDATVGKVLALVNRDRVGVAHFKRRPATETRLRANVGKHMWNVVDALKELL